MRNYTLSIEVELSANKKSKYFLADPISVSRKIDLKHQSNAFSLPKFESKPVNIDNKFVGDVLQGGSCNVDMISFTPHNLTHLETSAHILGSGYALVNDIPSDRFHGIVYLHDLTTLNRQKTIISNQDVEEALNSLSVPISALAIKTASSNLPADYDFSNKNFLALSPSAMKRIRTFNRGSIKSLILDLPSADPEKDDGKLLAHREFFGISKKGIEGLDVKKRIIIELAYFEHVDSGYYYWVTTPAKIEGNAMITDILFYPLLEQSEGK